MEPFSSSDWEFFQLILKIAFHVRFETCSHGLGMPKVLLGNFQNTYAQKVMGIHRNLLIGKWYHKLELSEIHLTIKLANHYKGP